jgi:hypothetical protein
MHDVRAALVIDGVVVAATDDLVAVRGTAALIAGARDEPVSPVLRALDEGRRAACRLVAIGVPA